MSRYLGKILNTPCLGTNTISRLNTIGIKVSPRFMIFVCMSGIVVNLKIPLEMVLTPIFCVSSKIVLGLC